ncbi:uncharacterized protein [Ciconia boyciana]|uniref:uncharacterized protein n=1 Tax=Ciconia boyciana TaxID=52775 RepID=UPI003B9DEA69
MAEWVALPSISGGPRGPFRDLRGPGKGMVGGDWGPDQGAVEQPLPRGLPSRSPGSAGPLRRVSPRRPTSPRRPGGGSARSPTTGPCPPPPRRTAAAAHGLTPPPHPRHSGDKARTPPPPPPGSPSVPPARRPGCRPRGGRWASAGSAGRAAPLSLLHYCHGRSEQCNNERASVRRGAARAGDEPVTARGDGTSRRPPRATLTGGGGGGCATFFVQTRGGGECAQRRAGQGKVSGSAHRPAPGPRRPPLPAPPRSPRLAAERGAGRPAAVPGRHRINKETPTSPVAAFSSWWVFLAGHQPLPPPQQPRADKKKKIPSCFCPAIRCASRPFGLCGRG